MSHSHTVTVAGWLAGYQILTTFNWTDVTGIFILLSTLAHLLLLSSWVTLFIHYTIHTT